MNDHFFILTKGFIMSYLSNNFDAFQEGIINGGYDPQEQDNHPVAGGDDDWVFGWGAEPTLGEKVCFECVTGTKVY